MLVGGFIAIPLFSGACFSRAKLYKCKRFFFPSVRLKKRVCYQAFLTDIVETEDKNRDDFHCMQMSLVMSMRVIFGDD